MSKIDVNAKLAATEASLKRWHTRLSRAINKVHELERQRLRYQKLLLGTMPQAAMVKATVAKVPAPEVIEDFVKKGQAAQAAVDALTVPAFLDRADPHIAAKMTAARKAKEAEKRKEMPLTGKAALAKIRERK